MELTSKSRRLRKLAIISCAWALALLVTGIAVISLVIGANVRAASRAAIRQHGGKAVDALMACVDDSNHSLAERNRAIWALGQLGDRRALPVLLKHDSGKECDHPTAVCQRELQKAIKLTKRGVNITAPIWRPSSITWLRS